ncbi:fluoride efflux transporter FluC [Microcella sp.]|uniref:fluoride efflux transporter FluC n=1 Tax=Microcella sp. TaxID=1913979 RepID=UPI003F71D9BF
MTSSAHPVAGARPGPRDLAAVLVGGALGTALRLAVDAALPHTLDQVALSTLIVNTLGAFVLGLLVALVWPRVPGWARAGLGAGLLGSFTTFSALAVSVVALAEAGDALLAVGTVVVSLALGLLAAGAGLALGRRGSGPGARAIDEVTE